ncbi:MAG: MFS transporter [bacterium]|nr:MFS transporter [bacterium]
MRSASHSDAVFVAFRVFTRLMVHAPWLYHFSTSVRGLSATEFGWMIAIFYLAVVLLEVPSGVLADRFGRRRLLVTGAFANVLACVMLATAFDFLAFAMAQVLLAIGTATVSGANSALLFDRLAAEGREKDYARIEGISQGAWLIVTAVAMVLADLFLVEGGDPTPAVIVTGSFQVVGVIFAFGLHDNPQPHGKSARAIAAAALENVLQVPGAARWIAISVGVFVLIRSAIVLLYNPILDAALVPIDRWGSLLALINLAGGVAAWQAHRWTGGRGAERMVILLPVALVGMYAGLATLHSGPAVLLFCIQGVAFGVYPVAMRTVLNHRIPDPLHRATVLSIESLACRLAFAGTAAAVGALLDRAELGWAIFAAVGLGLLPLLASALLPPTRPSTGQRDDGL